MVLTLKAKNEELKSKTGMETPCRSTDQLILECQKALEKAIPTARGGELAAIIKTLLEMKKIESEFDEESAERVVIYMPAETKSPGSFLTK